jgi:large conductance mechanosensitive channel
MDARERLQHFQDILGSKASRDARRFHGRVDSDGLLLRKRGDALARRVPVRQIVYRDREQDTRMTLLDEFKKFIARGNVLDLAVGVIIGAAFGKIVTALTENIIMPVIGWAFGDIDFSNYFVTLSSVPASYKGSVTDYAGLKAAGVAMLGYGAFVTQVINFLIIAAVLFMLLRSVNKMVDKLEREKKAVADTAAEELVATDPQLDILKEILVELKRRDGAAA